LNDVKLLNDTKNCHVPENTSHIFATDLINTEIYLFINANTFRFLQSILVLHQLLRLDILH